MVLAFAGSDPTGGAGVQADVLTLASLGCHPLSVVTALTVQDTSGVEAVHAVAPELVERQARRLLDELPVAAFKLGVLASVENIGVIARILSEHSHVPVVLDPVLASGRGDPLATAEVAGALRQQLLPLTTVLTPNSLEARQLAGGPGEEGLSLEECARRLVRCGSRYVLITGTHETGDRVVNTLYAERGVVRADDWQRLPASYHGSGCTLASAIAAGLAHGLAPAEAVRAAQDYTWRALDAGFRPGKGQHLPDRFFLAHP